MGGGAGGAAGNTRDLPPPAAPPPCPRPCAAGGQRPPRALPRLLLLPERERPGCVAAPGGGREGPGRGGRPGGERALLAVPLSPPPRSFPGAPRGRPARLVTSFVSPVKMWCRCCGAGAPGPRCRPARTGSRPGHRLGPLRYYGARYVVLSFEKRWA